MNVPRSHAEIGPAAPLETDAALALVFSRLAPDQAEGHQRLYRDCLADGSLPTEGVQVARRAGRLVGAMLFQTQPGRTAVAWPPRLAEGEPEQTAQQLLAAAVGMLTARSVRLASVLLEPPAEEDEQLLRTAGFSHLADLLYLVSFVQDLPGVAEDDLLEYETYREEDRSRFARVIEETYANSLDCAGLEGVRDSDDVLAGYRATGEFSPERWLLVRQGGRDVGCLLLTDHPQEQNWELVYMGVIEQARGHGWGGRIVRHAQALTRRAGRPRLVLAVDAANRPALQMYEAAGFQAWDRRIVYTRVLAAE